MNKTMQSVFLLLLFFFSVSVMSACLDEGDNVTLTGVLKKKRHMVHLAGESILRMTKR